MHLLSVIFVKSVIIFSLFLMHSDCQIGVPEQLQKVFQMKFIVEAGGRYCFSQFMETGETLTINYAVVQSKVGHNMTLDFMLTESANGNLLIHVNDTTSLEVEEFSGGVGDFHLCFLNHRDSMDDKVVIIYMNAYKSHNWDNTDGELSQLDVIVDSFKRSFDNTEDQVESAIKHILGFRLRESNDLALLENTFKKVNLWSCTNCVLIGLVAILQVYFVRTLFDGKSTIFQ